MIKEFVDRFFARKEELKKKFEEKHPGDYLDLVTSVIEILSEDASGDNYCQLDPEKIHVIDDGDYQGTLLFIIPEKGYQPQKYWAAKVEYGSCSVCDTLQHIRDYNGGKPSEKQIANYMQLALHIVQNLKSI